VDRDTHRVEHRCLCLQGTVPMELRIRASSGGSVDGLAEAPTAIADAPAVVADA